MAANQGEDIQKHFEDWQILLNKYYADLLSISEECFYRALEVIPQEFEDEIVMRPEIRTQTDVYQFVTTKTTHQKHLAQQRALIQSWSRRAPMSELSTKTSDISIDDIVAKTIAALQKQNSKKEEKPRARSTGPSPGKFLLKPWASEKGLRPLQENAGRKWGDSTKGGKGAFEKAKEAWLKENRPRSKSPKSLKPMLSEDSPAESDDEADLHPLGSMRCTTVFELR